MPSGADTARAAMVAECRRLLDAGQARAAYDLSRSAAPGDYWAAGLAALRLRAAAGLHDRPLLLAEEQALRDRMGDDPELRRLALRINATCRLPARIGDFLWAWGPPRARIEDHLADLADTQGFAMQPALGPRLHALRGGGPDRAEFVARFATGAALRALLSHVGRLEETLRGADRPLTEDEHAVIALHAQEARIVPPIDLSPVLAAQAEGRSVVIAAAHLDMPGRFNWVDGGVRLPRARVRRRPLTPAEARTLDISTVQPDLALRYLKLVKAMRRTPHFVEIYPDAADGGEIATGTLAGHPFRIGRGAAHLAFQSRAAPFFPACGWDGARFVRRLIPGPRAEAGMAPDDYDAAFTAFYTGCLSDMLTGPPEAISGVLLHLPAPGRPAP
ncbi:MAG: hypothetical protein KF887_08015 [Paracoccaceae bacterium]|nr:MAG: hypothetical protein KF887_08015 [Paracoccaceae bacterium]